MALSRTLWPRRKQIAVNGAIYDIGLSEGDGIFRATWYCDQCDEQGTWVAASATAEQAAKLVTMAAEIHHTLVHGPVYAGRKGQKRT